MILSKCHFFSKEIQYLGHILSSKAFTHCLQKQAIQKMHPPTAPKQVCVFLGLVGYYRKFIKNFTKIAKPLTLLTRQKGKFEWTPTHHEAFLQLKDSIMQAPILQYPNPSKRYIVYTDASDDACGAQLTLKHDGIEFLITFLSHTFSETQRKEHNWTRGPWSLLCCHQVELLSSRSWHHSQKWSQAAHKIFEWKEYK